MSAGAVRLNRVLRATPDRVHRALLDADAMAKWLPPHGYTEMSIVQKGLPEVIPVEACCLGWQESPALLAQLVEPEIPG